MKFKAFISLTVIPGLAMPVKAAKRQLNRPPRTSLRRPCRLEIHNRLKVNGAPCPDFVPFLSHFVSRNRGYQGLSRSITGSTFEVKLVARAGLEPATTCLEGRCSIQLSYRAVWCVVG